MLKFDPEFKIHLEQWSNIIHSRSRCAFIKARKKTKRNGFDPKVPRMDFVMEMREIVDKLPKGTHIVDIMYMLIRSRKKEEYAVTIKELALALHPEKFYVDNNGDKQPTHESIQSAMGALTRLRKVYAGLIVPFSKLMKQWKQNRYYDFKDRDEFKPVKDRAFKQADGIVRGIEVAEDCFNEDPMEREHRAREAEKEILGKREKDIHANNNSKKKSDRKKKKGDNDNDDNEKDEGAQ